MRNKKNKRSAGGKRRGTRKLSRGASDWNKAVMRVYKEMKAANKNVRFGDALKRASELKKKGQL
jgi:hypothetical protein